MTSLNPVSTRGKHFACAPEYHPNHASACGENFEARIVLRMWRRDDWHVLMSLVHGGSILAVLRNPATT